MAILKKAPAGAVVLDLEAARAARAEARAAAGEAISVIKLAAGFVQVRPELDLLCAEDFANARFHDGLAKLLVDQDDVDVLLEDGLTKDDLDAISSFITGTEPGE